MIKERYVSFEVAKMLKEKGFNEHTICRYVDTNGATERWYDDYRERVLRFELNAGDLIEPSIEPKEKYELYGDTIPAPTLYMTMEWLRENGVYMYVEPFITISSEGYNLEGYRPWITTFKKNWFNPLSKIGTATYSKTYEAAVEAVIKYCLETLI